jgi:hypothetical protein
MISYGISLDKNLQRQSLQWIREQSMSPDYLESLATHDTDVTTHVIVSLRFMSGRLKMV